MGLPERCTIGGLSPPGLATARWRALARFAMVRADLDTSAPSFADAELDAVQQELEKSKWPAAALDAAVTRVKVLAPIDSHAARAVLEAARPLTGGLPAASRA